MYRLSRSDMRNMVRMLDGAIFWDRADILEDGACMRASIDPDKLGIAGLDFLSGAELSYSLRTWTVAIVLEDGRVLCVADTTVSEEDTADDLVYRCLAQLRDDVDGAMTALCPRQVEYGEDAIELYCFDTEEDA